MNTDAQSSMPENNALETIQDWLFDSFCQPRTIPDAWDLTSMSSVPKTNGNYRPVVAPAQHHPESAEQTEDTDSGASFHNQYLNPFPEPRTYPAYWGLI